MSQLEVLEFFVARIECGRRWGRWTGRELFGDALEPRYGKEFVTSPE